MPVDGPIDRELRKMKTRSFQVFESIPESVDVVWDVMTHFAQLPSWMKSVDTVRVLTEPPVGVGCELELHLSGQRSLWVLETWVPKERFALSTRQGGLTLRFTYSLSEKQGTTDVHFLAEVEAGGFFYKLLLPILHYGTRTRERHQLLDLKSALENRTP